MGNDAKPVNYTKCGLCSKSSDDQSLCGMASSGMGFFQTDKVHKRYALGDTIYLEDTPCTGIYCLKSGLVALRKTDANGNSVVVRLILPGEVFGHRAYLANEKHAGTAEALLESKLCFIPKNELDSIFINSPDTALRFTRRVAKDLREIEELYLMTTTQPVRKRLIHLLLGFHERFTQQMPSSSLESSFELPLSRQELAAVIGTRPETIARTIKKLEIDGLCHFELRMVKIFDPDKLRDAMECDE